MSFQFEETSQRNDRSKRRRHSFSDHGMTTTVSAEQYSQYHPNQLPLTSSSQLPTSLSTAPQHVSPQRSTMSAGDGHLPEDSTPPIRRGKRKPSSKVVRNHRGLTHRLNNEGVQCIHRGQYEDAISNTARAIRLCQSEDVFPNNSSISLDAILSHHFLKPRGVSISPSSERGKSTEETNDKTEVEVSRDWEMPDDGYGDFVYSEGIMLPEECQAPAWGETLHVVLSFNLALAHHLSWTTEKDTGDIKKLNHIVQLYELAYRLALQIQTNSSENEVSPEKKEICNLRFTLVIINNLSQIHRVLNDTDDSNEVLEGLLSHLMVVATVQQYHSRSIAEDPRNSANGRRDRLGAASTDIDLDGFFRNVLPLLLKKNTAGAA